MEGVNQFAGSIFIFIGALVVVFAVSFAITAGINIAFRLFPKR